MLDSKILTLNDPQLICEEIEKFIRSKLKQLNRDGVILGLSGGIDSVIACYLCVRALGSNNVTALYMPEKDSKAKHYKL